MFSPSTFPRYRFSSFTNHSFSNRSKSHQRWASGTYGHSLKFWPLQHPCGYMVVIWVLSNWLALRMLSASHSHVVTICGLPCRVSHKVNGEASGKVDKFSVFMSHALHSHLSCAHAMPHHASLQSSLHSTQHSCSTTASLIWDSYHFLLNDLHVLGCNSSQDCWACCC